MAVVHRKSVLSLWVSLSLFVHDFTVWSTLLAKLPVPSRLTTKKPCSASASNYLYHS